MHALSEMYIYNDCFLLLKCYQIDENFAFNPTVFLCRALKNLSFWDSCSTDLYRFSEMVISFHCLPEHMHSSISVPIRFIFFLLRFSLSKISFSLFVSSSGGIIKYMTLNKWSERAKVAFGSHKLYWIIILICIYLGWGCEESASQQNVA